MRETLFYWVTRFTSFVFFYFGWGISLQQASVGHALVGPLVVFGMFVFQLFFTKEKIPDIILALTALIVGTIVDSLYGYFQLLRYLPAYSQFPWVAPLWVGSVWVLYAMCLNHSLVWLRRRWALSALCGALGAFFSYLAGFRLQAAESIAPQEIVLIIVSLVWSVITPLSLWYAEKVDLWWKAYALKKAQGESP